MDEGNIILARNLMFCLNKATSNYFLDYNVLDRIFKKKQLQLLQEDRLKHHKNLLTDYLDINSLRNKITDLRIIMKTLSLDYLILSKTKIDESFPTAQI